VTRRRQLGQLAAALGLLGLAACASEVVRRPAQLTAAIEAEGGTFEALKPASVKVGPGYERNIDVRSRWTRVGRIPEGDVYKPVGRVFTVEGAHIHEAYLVLDGDRIAGFYLPVERAFSPAPDGGVTRVTFRRLP
jgi:hypothetical protein